MATTKSSRNPFRDPLSSFRTPLAPASAPPPSQDLPPSPPSSGTANAQPGPPDRPLNAARSPSPAYTPPPGPPPASSSHSPASAARAESTSNTPPPSFGLDDELPPAYTPSADLYSGEQTVEYGPRRPFQPPPPPPAQTPAISLVPQPPPSHQQQYPTPPPRPAPLISQLTGRGSGTERLGSFLTQLAELAISRTGASSSSSNSYGQASSSSHGNMPGAYPPSGYHTPQPPQQQRYAAPPGPPPLPARPPASPSGPGTRPQLGGNADSDFARDFYAAGAVVPGIEPDVDSGAHPTLSPTATGTPSPLQPTPTGSSARSGTNARGKPTTTPTPGHPYLHEGQLLVYPKGFECRKCHNTGYKLPSLKPCKRCWPKYGRAFSGALVYAYEHPSEAHGEGDLESSSNFQRPLPFPPSSHSPSAPHSSASYPPSSPYPPVGPSSHSGYPGTASRLSRGGFMNMGMVTPGAVPMLRPMATGSYVGRPPGGAVVYPPGDPRLGGRQCWRCGGDGWVAGLLLVDRSTCGVCGGIGRVYS